MDTISQRERSRVMANVKSHGNKSTELRLISILKRRDLKGWRRNYPLFGKPDFTYPKYKIAIFIDGCFWHGCPTCYRRPNSNRAYWDSKVKRNIMRDLLVKKELRKKGWIVLRFRECQLKNERKLSSRIAGQISRGIERAH